MPSCRFQGVLLSILEYPQTWHRFSHFPTLPRMSRWRLVTLVSVLLGGTGLMSNCKSAVKGSPKLQPPYLRENQREMHCCPHPKALIPWMGHANVPLPPPGNSSLTSESYPSVGPSRLSCGSLSLEGKKTKKLRSLATLSQSCCKPPFEEDAGAVCLPLQGEMLPLTQEMSSSVCQ